MFQWLILIVALLIAAVNMGMSITGMLKTEITATVLLRDPDNFHLALYQQNGKLNCYVFQTKPEEKKNFGDKVKTDVYTHIQKRPDDNPSWVKAAPILNIAGWALVVVLILLMCFWFKRPVANQNV